MLSRVAENIYWMARYVERAENTARLVSVNSFLLLDLPRGIAPGWAQLVAITGSHADFKSRFDDSNERSVVKFLIGDSGNPSSIISSLDAARENVRTVREILPRMAWEQLTELYHFAKDNLASGLTKKGRHDYLTGIVAGSQRLVGMLNSTMMRDEAYDFMRIGANLERADMTTRIIDVRSANLLPNGTSEWDPFEGIQWMSVLKSLTAYHAYRRKLQARVQREAVLSFLFLDSQFPRSVQHCLVAAEESLGNLPLRSETMRELRGLGKRLRQSDVESLEQGELHEFIDDLQMGLHQVHHAIAAAYFLTGLEQTEPRSALPDRATASQAQAPALATGG